MKSKEVKYFEGFGSDVYIPSIGPEGINYTWVSEELADEAVYSGWMSAPEEENEVEEV